MSAVLSVLLGNRFAAATDAGFAFVCHKLPIGETYLD